MDAEYHAAIDPGIDESGHVVHAGIIGSVHPVCDRELLRAAQGWRNDPARRDGTPVASLKRVEVVVRAPR